MWDIMNKSDYHMEEEVIDTSPTEYIEEDVFIDENFIKNKELIRMDMNLIQFPIFSKNTKRKSNQVVTYYFNKNRATYIKVSPTAGDYIPGEMEEKIFIALMQIMKEKNLSKKFIVTAKEIKDKLKMGSGTYNNTIKKSLSRLSTTNYSFKNTFYSSANKGVLEKEISTTMLSLETITLSLKENEKYRNTINDKRVKEIYIVTMSDHFYENIVQKGYMVYNGNTLLKIESSTARTIYMLIEKLRFDKLYLKIDTIFLIKRIPLKYDKKHMSQTIKTLSNSLEELVEKKLIKNFKIIKETTWSKSEIEINFFENANDKKQDRFYNDKNDFKKIMTTLTISDTEHCSVNIDEIMELMPSKAKTLKTMPKTIKESIELYGYDKVKKSAIYTKKQKPEKVRAYFLKALESNWAEDTEIIDKQVKLASVVKNVDEETSLYKESLYKEFEELSEDVQDGIEGYAYREYVEKCGMDTKIQRLAFRASRKKLICEFLEKNSQILKKDDEAKEEVKEIVKVEYMTDMEEIKKLISNTIVLASMLNKYSKEEGNELLFKVLREIIPIMQSGELTKEQVIKKLSEYTGI